jgi:hypothetical protein
MAEPIMFPLSPTRLLTSLVILACFCQSGFAAVQWEMSWESASEFSSMTPPSEGDGSTSIDAPLSFAGSMEAQPAASSVSLMPCLAEVSFWSMPIVVRRLSLFEASGDIIRVPWCIAKVPIL